MSDRSQHDPGVETGPRQATPFTRVWYIAFLVMGLALFFGGLLPWEPALAIADLPDGTDYNLYGWGLDWSVLIHLALGSSISIGAAFSIYGAAWRERIDDSWVYERTGALIAVPGWIAFVLAICAEQPLALIDILFPFTAAIALTVRLVSLWRRERVVRVAYKEKQDEQR